MVRLAGDLGGQAMGFGPEQPRRRPAQQLLGLVEWCLTIQRAGQDLQSGLAQLGDGGVGVGFDDDGNREDAARGGAQTLAVVGVHTVSREDHCRSTHGVGDADQRARIARLADLDRDRDQPGRPGQHVSQPGLRRVAHRDQTCGSNRVGQRFCGPLRH